MKKPQSIPSQTLVTSIPISSPTAPLIVLSFLLLACGCNNPHPSNPNKTKPTTTQTDTANQSTQPGNLSTQNQIPASPQKPAFKYGSPLLLQYDQWLATLDTQKISNSRIAVSEFRRLFAGQPPSICDTAYYLFEHFHDRLTGYLVQNPDTTNLDPLTPPGPGVKPAPLSPRLQKIADTLASNGFRAFEEEGNAYVTRDISFMKKNFSPYVTATMKEYLTQMAKEDSKPFQEDAALLIPPYDLAYRAIWWEQFVHRHPDHIYTYSALHIHKFYFQILLQGMDNTPVLSDNHLTDYYEAAYDFVTAQYPRSETNIVVAPWYKALRTNDSTTIQKIREKYHLEQPY